MAGCIDKGDDSLEFLLNVLAAVRALARGVELAFVVLVEGRVSVAEFDGDASLSFLRVRVGPNAESAWVKVVFPWST